MRNTRKAANDRLSHHKNNRSPDRSALRFLAVLTSDRAMPAREDLREGYLTIAAANAKITTIIASAPASVGVELIAHNLAVWKNVINAGVEKRFLFATPEGIAYAKRIAAVGVEPFLAQHMQLKHKPVEPGASPAWVDEAENPLSWLARRKGRNGVAFLNATQLLAGERFHKDIVMAQLTPRITSDWSGAPSSGGGPGSLVIGEVAIGARKRVDKVFATIGAELADLLVDVCGFEKGLELVERERQWPARSAKIVLRLALDALATHYTNGHDT